MQNDRALKTAGQLHEVLDAPVRADIEPNPGPHNLLTAALQAILTTFFMIKMQDICSGSLTSTTVRQNDSIYDPISFRKQSKSSLAEVIIATTDFDGLLQIQIIVVSNIITILFYWAGDTGNQATSSHSGVTQSEMRIVSWDLTS